MNEEILIILFIINVFGYLFLILWLRHERQMVQLSKAFIQLIPQEQREVLFDIFVKLYREEVPENEIPDFKF